MNADINRAVELRFLSVHGV